MNTYIMNFTAYFFAMIGFIITMVYIYKKAINPTCVNKEKNFLKVENMLKLSPVKTVYVIKAGNERFLIAGDSSNTTMLAKLENNNEGYINNDENEKSSEFSPLRVLKKIGKC